MTLTDVERRETAGTDEARRRAAHLLARMTVEEKVGQLHLMTVHRALDGSRRGGSHFQPGALRDLLETPSPVGGVLSGAGGVPVPNSPTSWREMVEELQEHAVRSSRLGVPLLYATDAIHGHNNVLGETVLPYAVGVGASWDPDLAREVAAATAHAMRATGVPWNFAPDADLGRDPRWGRFCETYGEDPTLVAAMVAATVRGLQGDGPGVGTGSVAATVKHFVGYGSATNGLDRGDAEIPARVLRDRHLPAFRAAIGAGALAVMANSGSVNGVPVHMSRYLLTDVLRGELGFDGLVVSDWGDALFLERYYRTADTYADAVALSIGAGIDMVMAPFAVENLAETVLMLLEQGRVAPERVDEAALRVLTLKFRLGLFDDPVAHPAPVAGTSPTAAVALDAARRGVVLLRNSGSTLPLRPDARVCLVGPGASSVARLMGGLTIDWQGIGEDPAQWPPCTTIADGLRAVLGADRVLEPETADDRRGAMAACDAVVAVLGEHPYAEYAGDDRRLELPPDQVALVEEAQAAGVPVVVVLLAGRPVVLGPAVARADAILMAHLPGSAGGPAVADVLTGRHNPGARLPYSWPRHAGQLPMPYDVLPAAADGEQARGFRGPMYDPEFELGHGLGYTEVQVESVTAPARLHADEPLVLHATVRTGAGPAVRTTVPVFVRAVSATPVSVPRRRVLGWFAVEQPSSTTREVEVTLSLDPLSVTSGDVDGVGTRAVPAGRYELLVQDHPPVAVEILPGRADGGR